MIFDIGYAGFRYEKGARISGRLGDKVTSQELREYLSGMNHMTSLTTSKYRLLGDIANISFVCLSDAGALVVHVADKLTGRFRYYGMVFKRQDIRTVWFFMDRICEYILRHDEAAIVEGKQVELAEYSKLAVPAEGTGDPADRAIAMLRDKLRAENTIFSFILGPTTTEVAKKIRVFAVETGEIPKAGDQRHIELAAIMDAQSRKDADNGGFLTYRFPSMKERPHEKNFFQEFKEIRQEQRSGAVYWEYRYVEGGDSRVAEATVPEAGMFTMTEMMKEYNDVRRK